MKILKKILKSKIFWIFFIFLISILILWNWPSIPSTYEYGVTYSAKYARELSLDPKDTLKNIVDELNLKKIRLVAYWDEIESQKNVYDFSDLDWQMNFAEENNLEIVLAIGKRVPRYPECHVPEWAKSESIENQQNRLLDYIGKVVSRYKNYESLKIWQVENEPFLTVYVPEFCGSELDVNFFDKEIELVRRLDPDRKILTTDSGNLGKWLGAYKRGDIFGSTFYIYLTDSNLGQIKSFLNYNIYKFKRFISEIFYGKKEVWLAEVSLEPWLTKPIREYDIEETFEYMNIERIDEILDKSAKTNFEEIYLWGAEWWYYLKLMGYPDIWNHLKNKINNY